MQSKLFKILLIVVLVIPGQILLAQTTNPHLVLSENSILRSRSRELDPSEFTSSQTKALIRKLRRIMVLELGIGIAAPQVGIPIRLILVVPSDSAAIAIVPFRSSGFVMINPVPEVLDQRLRSFIEGCLSLPFVFGWVPRARSVKVQYVNEAGNPTVQVFRDYTSNIVQHEIDHLNGILFTDHPGFHI